MSTGVEPASALLYARGKRKEAAAAEERGDVADAIRLYDLANLNAFAAMKAVIELDGGYAGHQPRQGQPGRRA